MRTHTGKQLPYIGKPAKGRTSVNALHVLTMKVWANYSQKKGTASETRKMQVRNVVLWITAYKYPPIS